MIRFLQLSDIHLFFTDDEDGDDRQIHVSLLDNLKTFYSIDGNINGILICGDIVHSCKKEQYVKASKFIQEMCSIISCQPYEVYVVPGNHDKDRDCDHPRTRDLMYNELRSSNGNTYFKAIKNDEFNALKILYSPLMEYYEFAAQYLCCDNVASSILVSKNQDNTNINPDDKIYWSENLYKTNNFNLNLFGINSVLTSCEDDESIPLFLPKLAYNIARSKWDINIVMMHHPLTEKNIINHETIQTTIDEKFNIQLYGHEHKQHSEADEESSAPEGVIRIYSGALNPHGEYDAEYCPSYNIIDIDICEESQFKCLVSVDISSHKWDGTNFYKDTNESKKYCIHVDNSDSIDSVNPNNNNATKIAEINMKELQYKFMSRSDRKSLINKIMPKLYDEERSEHINSINFLKQLESEKKKTELWYIIN